MAFSGPEVTRLPAQARNEDRSALNQLVPLVYQELRRLAKKHIVRQRSGHTLQTIDLVNEAYLKLAHTPGKEWKDRGHFLCAASRAMRCVLVDHARKRGYAKHGRNPVRVALDEALTVSEQCSLEVLAIDESLTRLAALDPRKSQIVELRYFGGLSIEETAEVVRVSPVTVTREWAKAKAWLYEQLRHGRML